MPAYDSILVVSPQARPRNPQEIPEISWTNARSDRHSCWSPAVKGEVTSAGGAGSCGGRGGGTGGRRGSSGESGGGCNPVLATPDLSAGGGGASGRVWRALGGWPPP